MVVDYTSEYFHVEGAMSGMAASKPLQVVKAAVKVTHPYNNDTFICVINQALLVNDNDYVEALLQPHQARNFVRQLTSVHVIILVLMESFFFFLMLYR